MCSCGEVESREKRKIAKNRGGFCTQEEEKRSQNKNKKLEIALEKVQVIYHGYRIRCLFSLI